MYWYKLWENEDEVLVVEKTCTDGRDNFGIPYTTTKRVSVIETVDENGCFILWDG